MKSACASFATASGRNGGRVVMHTERMASRQRLYKGKYLIALCERDEVALTRYSFACVAEMARFFGKKYSTMASRLTHDLKKGKAMLVGRRLMDVVLVEVEPGERKELEEGYPYAG